MSREPNWVLKEQTVSMQVEEELEGAGGVAVVMEWPGMGLVYGDITVKLARSKTVSVLGREEEYTMKYGLSPRKFPRGQPEGTCKGSGHVS